jgi:hypothetical protein
MCTRYITPDQAAIEREWELGRHNSDAWLRQVFGRELFPRQSGPFIRRTRDDAGYSRELVVGRWGLIPPFSATPDVKFATWNARSEDMARKASFKEAWARGQRAGHGVLRAQLGDRAQRVVALCAARRCTLGRGRPVAPLGGQKNRRDARVIHHAHARRE